MKLSLPTPESGHRRSHVISGRGILNMESANDSGNSITPESDCYAKLMMEIKDEAKKYKGEFKLALPSDQDVVDISKSCGGLLSPEASSSASLENSGIIIHAWCMSHAHMQHV
ncbi:hypothetical protein AXG93_1403s1000 [Marchantia polymorpha subsp. ruderalis]|uniref:Uncharacterized protein n=1 Tax=Marchantia polymorpha subsp. ruderalis TaxID=1480154 RepID=A0A176VGL8_MARPO|nr:hypothetical protein AXG93_1403s1000 [Marchantia polymorpha subsp. ruderalis]